MTSAESPLITRGSAPLAIVSLAQAIAIPLAFSLIVSLGVGCKSIAPTPPEPTAVRVPVDLVPAWSPDGHYVSYSHFQGPGTDTLITGLYILDVQTGVRRRIRTGSSLSPEWFADSQRLAFASGHTFGINLDGSALAELVPFASQNPSFSPSDTAIAFDSPLNDPSGASAIWIYSRVTGSLRDISTHGTGEWKNPKWSPDGRWLLHYRFGPAPNGTSELFVMDTAGGNVTRITNDAVNDKFPCWSPSGSLIAWTRGASGSQEIWVANSDGSDAHRLHVGAYPSFSPDGTRIVFIDPSSADGVDLHSIKLDGTDYRAL